MLLKRKRSRLLIFLFWDNFVTEVVISFYRRFVFIFGESLRRGVYHLRNRLLH